MRYLKQSTSVDVGIGPFLDETDGKTAETALTITQPDVRLKKNGGAWAQKAAAQTLTHEEAGWYEVTLDATDTDTIGHLLVAVHESGALPVWMEFHVLAANVYDSLFGAATDKLDVNVEEWNTTAVPAEHTAGYPIVTVKDGTGTGEINTNAGAIALVDLVTTLTTYTGNTVQTGDAFARIGAAGAGLTAVPWNASWDAEVQSEVQDAIEVNHLDHLFAVADPGGVVANSSFWAALTSKSATPAYSSYNNTTDSLEAQADATTVIDDFLDTEVAAILAAVDTEVGAIKTVTDQITFGTANRVNAQVYGMEAGVVTAAVVATGAIDADALAADVVNDIWMGTALTEAYAADGAAATPAQLLYQIWSRLVEVAISGTTMTTKKLDGTTSAMTFTLNDGTNPTTVTRAT